MKLFARCQGRESELDIRPDGEALVAAGTRIVLHDGSSRARVGDRIVDFSARLRDGAWTIQIDGVTYEVTISDASSATRPDSSPGTGGPSVARAPIPGLITRVMAKPGDPVKKHEPVLCLDAMKLENEIGAPRTGVIRSIDVRPGQPVDKGQALFVVE